MSLPRRVALRYLFARKSHKAVNIISMVSVAGIAVATVAIVCVLSVFNGFSRVALDRLSVFDPDYMITARSGSGVISHADSLASVVASVPGVASAVPLVREQALAMFGDRQLTVDLRGVDMRSAMADTAIRSTIIDGEFMPYGDASGISFATLGIGVAIDLQARPGYYEWLRLYAPRRHGRINPANPIAAFRADSMIVSGVFQLNQAEYDATTVIVPLDAARRLFELGDAASAIEVTLGAGADAAAVGSDIERVLGSAFQVDDRLRQQFATYRMINVEKWITLVLLVFILVIASFNVMSTLSMLVLEKRADMLTFSAMGAGRGFARSVFMHQGIMITLTGGVAGMALGVVLCLLQQHFGLIKLNGDPEHLSITSYPVVVEWSDLAVVGIVLIAVALLVGIMGRMIMRSVERRQCAAA